MRTKQTARKPFAALHGRGGSGPRTSGGAVSKPAATSTARVAMGSKARAPLHKQGGAGTSSSNGQGSSDKEKEKAEAKPEDEEDIEDEEEVSGEEDLEGEDGEEDMSDEDMDEEGEPDSEEEEYMQMLETFQEVVDSQNYSGSFPVNEMFARVLGVTRSQLVQEAEKKKLNVEGFTTALALIFVTNRLHMEDNMKTEWEPVKTKATSWLESTYPDSHAEITAAATAYVEDI